MSVRHPSMKGQPCGARLIEALRLLTRDMRELPDEYDPYHDVFFDWQRQLYAGWKAKEPLPMYLLAEYCRLTPDAEPVLALDAEDVPPSGLDAAEQIYLDAAEQGCDLARLWLAYCYEEGRCGFRKEPKLSLRLQAEGCRPVDGLFPDELAFLYEELEDLYRDAEQALYLWDADQNPGFAALNERGMLFYGFLVLLGLPDVPRHERKSPLEVYNPAIEWKSPYDSLNRQSSRQKRDWDAWCREKGLLVSAS